MNSANLTATMSDDAFNLSSMNCAVVYNRAIAEMIHDRTAGLSVLDFGAGRGTFANTFCYPITCIEPEASLSENIFQHHQVHKSLADVTDRYDFIYSINVLEHIENDLSVLVELKKRLQPGGQLFLFLPAREDIYTEMDRYVGHYRRYDIRDIRDKLNAAGLVVTRWSYFDSLGYWATRATKLVGKVFGWKGRLSRESVAFYDSFIFPLSMLLDKLGFRGLIGKNLVIYAAHN